MLRPKQLFYYDLLMPKAAAPHNPYCSTAPADSEPAERCRFHVRGAIEFVTPEVENRSISATFDTISSLPLHQ